MTLMFLFCFLNNSIDIYYIILFRIEQFLTQIALERLQCKLIGLPLYLDSLAI